MKRQDLPDSEYNAYYRGYIHKLDPDTALDQGFKEGRDTIIQFFSSIPEEKQTYRYAPGKWTPKEILQHLIDAERVFSYRCFRIARKDKISLPGFDQDDYILPSRANEKRMQDLLAEYEATRNSFIALLDSLTDEDLQQVGEASGFDLSARAAAFMTLGHEKWHIEIIKNRYL
jgi:uncharacterized damage-inducible protein DinB